MFKCLKCLILHNCTVYRDMPYQQVVTFVNKKVDMFQSHFVDILETIKNAKHLNVLKLDNKAFELMRVNDKENFETPEKVFEMLCYVLASSECKV